MSRRSLFWVVSGLVLALAAFLGVIAVSWGAVGGGLSGHGWIAYGLGSFVTLALTLGLMMLSFHSARSGHDEAADQAHDDPSRPRD